MREVPGLRLIDLFDQRRFYLAVAALFGLPGLVLGVAGAGLGVWVGLTEPTHAGLPPPPVLVGWGLAGLLGLLAWVRLSTAWLLAGQEGLRWLHPAWWFLLGTGMAAALVLVGMALADRTPGHTPVLLLLAGPPVLFPAALLLVQRRRLRRAAPGS